jgi:hypothetical protein
MGEILEVRKDYSHAILSGQSIDRRQDLFIDYRLKKSALRIGVVRRRKYGSFPTERSRVLIRRLGYDFIVPLHSLPLPEKHIPTNGA